MELWGNILHKNSHEFSSIRVLHHFAVFILELLPYPISKQGAVLNPPNPYLRGTTVPLDKLVIWFML